MSPEVRMARVLDAISSHRAGSLSCVEARELLAVSKPHFRRLRDAFEERGEDGLIDRRRDRVSSGSADEAEGAWVAEMFRTRYFDFRIKHCHEQIVGMPMASGKPFRRSHTWTRTVLQLRGLTTKAPRRGVHASGLIASLRWNRGPEPVPVISPEQASSSHSRRRQFASGSGRIWNLTTLDKVPLPPSRCWGVRFPVVDHRPLPFQPALGSSMRASMPLA